MLGKQYVLQTAEPEDVIGRFNMNQNKLLVIMDEAQGKNTFAAPGAAFPVKELLVPREAMSSSAVTQSSMSVSIFMSTVFYHAAAVFFTSALLVALENTAARAPLRKNRWHPPPP